MSALANLAKYQGRYDQFLQLRQRYNLKWSKGDSLQYFARFFDGELTFDVMLQRIREMMRLLPPFMSRIIKFACLVGLRASEVVESVRLLNEQDLAHTMQAASYYNPERQALEHFRYPEVFLRQTKKAYISFVTPSMIEGLSPIGERVPSYNAIRLACYYQGIKCSMRYCRKIFASWLKTYNIPDFVIDILQGRVPPSVLARHYLVPQDRLRDDILQALHQLQKQLQ